MADYQMCKRHRTKAKTMRALELTEHAGRHMPDVILREKLIRDGVQMKHIKAYERLQAKKKSPAAAATASKGKTKNTMSL